MENKYLFDEERVDLIKLAKHVIDISEEYYTALLELHARIKNVTGNELLADNIADTIHNDNITLNDFIEVLDRHL